VSVECFFTETKAMPPGPVVDAAAVVDAGAEAQVLSVDDAALKKKPLPQVLPFTLYFLSIFHFTFSLIRFHDLFFLRKMMLPS